MTISIIDSDNAMIAARLAQLKAQGVVSIGRYLNRRKPGGEKVIKPDEAKLFQAANMRLFLIYEYDGHPSGSAVGALDGEWAAEYAPTIGAPTDGSAFIAYTVDWDAPASAMSGIRAAFASFGAAIAPKFKPWCYGSGAVCAELYAAKLIAGRWLTMSGGFRGTKDALASGAYEMRQLLDQHIAGLDVDPDSMHAAAAPVGFIPFTPESLVQRAEDIMKKVL